MTYVIFFVMWQIEKSFEDQYHPNGKGVFRLNADKDITPYEITYPITWTGFVSQEEVLIIQIDSSALTVNDFNFMLFPEKYNYMRRDIISAIHGFLKKLD